MKKERILIFIAVFIILSLSSVLARTTITGKVAVNYNSQNLPSLSPDMQEIYQQTSPAVVKILVYADYRYYLPLIKDIDFSVYNNKIDRGEYANFTSDVNVIYDATQNMYDQWGRDLNETDYSFDLNSELAYGSGFLINPEGYLLTNAHVAIINKSYEEYYTEFLILNSLYSYIDETYSNGGYLSDYDYAYDLATYNFMVNNLKVNISNIKIKVIVGVDDKEKGISSKEYTPQIIKFEGDPSKYVEESLDWALLKIDANNLPYLYLGDSDNISIGSDILLLGYPGISESQIITSENVNTIPNVSETFRRDVVPTLSKGYVSYIRPITGGYKNFQIDASITGGNSGGPLLSMDGKVVGIATYGYSEYQGGIYNYAQRINDIKSKIESVVTLPAESETPESNTAFAGNPMANLPWIIIGALVIVIIVMSIIIFFSKFKVSKKK